MPDLEGQLRRYADHVEGEVGDVPAGVGPPPRSRRVGWLVAAAVALVLVVVGLTVAVLGDGGDTRTGPSSGPETTVASTSSTPSTTTPATVPPDPTVAVDPEPVDGAGPQVPAVVGLFADTAQATLRNAGLEPVVEFTAVPSGDHRIGVVTSQSPPAFDAAAPGDEVVIRVGEDNGSADRFGDCPSRPAGSSPAVFDEATGTYAVLLDGYDPDRGTLRFDVVQWLSGDDAMAAWLEDDPDDPSGPPNDYLIRNDNPLVRALPVAEDAEVLLVRLDTDFSADVDPGTLAELPAYLTVGTGGSNPYWITVDDGTVTSICEQYVP